MPNAQFAIPDSGLESPRVKLTPYLPSTYNPEFFAQITARPDLVRWFLGIWTPAVIEDILGDPTVVLFAIIDKSTKRFAGVIGLLHTSFENRSTEIGPVICFPEFQRTYVTSHAIGVLMRHCLDVPRREEGEDGGGRGLGFRRVQWMANTLNVASLKAAERMGMKREGTLRWNAILPPGLEGKAAGEGRGEGLGRDSALLAICWDDWENGGRELVAGVMERTS